jgi:hypothetical protein
MEKYFRLDGLTYRIVPILSAGQEGQIGSIDSKILYENLINKFRWGNVADPKVYLDENNIRMLSNFRNNFSRLAEQLINENKLDSAVQVLDKCFKVMPINQVPLNYTVLPIIEQYARAKQEGKAKDLAHKLFDNLNQEAIYYFSIKPNYALGIDQEKRMCLYSIQQLGRITQLFDPKLSNTIGNTLQGFMTQFGPQQ